MESRLAGADLQQEMLRVSQVKKLAERVAVCLGRGEAVLDSFRDIQMLQWESPAGRAYRDAVLLQSAALRRALEALIEAKAAVERHSQETLTAGCTLSGGALMAEVTPSGSGSIQVSGPPDDGFLTSAEAWAASGSSWRS
jgi:hypothetical protein